MGILDNILLKRLIGTLVRTILTAVGGYLVSKGMASQTDIDAAYAPMTDILIGVVSIGGSLAWGWAQKFLSHNTVAVTRPNDLGDITTTAVKVTSEQVKRDVH